MGARLGDAQRDLDVLARHLPAILGRAIEPREVVQAGRVTTGRPDAVDENHHGVVNAMRVMQRLASIEWQPRLVLVYAYLVTGPEARERTAGFATRVGLVFASPMQRMSWLTMPAKALGLGSARKFGDQLLETAVQAYASVTETRPVDDGRWLSGNIDRVTRMDSIAARDLRTLTRVREVNRCAPPAPPGTPKNRKERRALLRAQRTERTA